MFFYSTNDKSKKVTFKQALLEGQSFPDYGLFMLAREDVPKLSLKQIKAMKDKTYAEIAFEVLSPYLVSEIHEDELKKILNDAYPSTPLRSAQGIFRQGSSQVLPEPVEGLPIRDISPKIQHVADKIYIMWLTKGPTYSFKDYAARFFGRTLNYFLQEDNQRKVVITATSGDTGGAVADALFGLENVDNIVFYPKDFISEGQRRQMTTLGKNIYAFAVNGDFDVCQALAKRLLGDKDFTKELFGDENYFTSANSISLGRLLPQAVYPFYAYSRITPTHSPYFAAGETGGEGGGVIASIPSGNFGDMMGTVIAKEMGLPISKIICGVNENDEFPEFLESGKYQVKPTKKSPSSAMMVSHPSNLARLIDFYGGHMYDERDSKTKKVTKQGVIDKMPNLDEMRKDIFSISISNEEHYQAIKEAYEKYKIILDPHGAVGWKALGALRAPKTTLSGVDKFSEMCYDKESDFSVIYETANPAKFPEDIERAINITPEIPKGIKKQAELEERIYSVNSEPDVIDGSQTLNESQYTETQNILRKIFKI